MIAKTVITIYLILLIPLGFSFFFTLLELWQVLRFKRNHPCGNTTSGRIAFTLLCPLHGVNERTYELLSNFCRQTLLPSEIRCGVDGADDPACSIVERLKHDFPAVPIKLFIGSNPDMPNRKIANLSKLAHEIVTPIVVVVDQDVIIESSHFEYVLSLFSDLKTGLVTCLYRIGKPKSIGSIFELLSIHTDFFPSVLAAEQLEHGLKFSFGATIAVRKEVLEKIGGFEQLGDYLADDYQIGAQVARSGHRVVVSGSIAEHFVGKLSIRDYWARQVRAVRTFRACRPGGYAFSLLVQGIPWLAGLLFLSGFSFFAVGCVLAWGIARASLAIASHRLLTKGKGPWWPLVFLPFYEAARFVFWMVAFSGGRVVWGENEYQILKDGKMARLG